MRVTKMNIKVREFNENDIQAANEIWNEVVEDGVAFPQEECLTERADWNFLRVSHIQVLRMMKKRVILSDSTYFIRTMSADAVIFAMQVMR